MRLSLARSVLIVLLGAVALLSALPALPAAAAVLSVPTPTGPDNGATLSNFSPMLTWSNPEGVTQYQLQVSPANNDGAGVDLHLGTPGTTFRIPPPPLWYGLLPDMTYTWRVRVSDAPTYADLNDASWSPWAERTFRTPSVSSSTITPLTPADGDTVTTLTPVLQWDNSRTDVFYYEVQVSQDRTFTTDPALAFAPVYGTVLHAGMTRPARAYAVNATYPLVDNATYYWRVRPRVQGDGAPVGWSSVYSFKTRRGAPKGVTVQSAAFGAAVPDTTCQIFGSATTFAASPTLTGLNYAYRYSGSGTVAHNWYINDQPASDVERTLETGSTCQGSTFGRPGGGAADGAPLPPGIYRLEVWAAGERIQTASFTVVPPAALMIGPVTTGTGIENVSGCTLSGTGAAFPQATSGLYFRFNYVGTGDYAVAVARGQAVVAEKTGQLSGPSGCRILPYMPSAGFVTGTYGVALGDTKNAQQSMTFTIP